MPLTKFYPYRVFLPIVFASFFALPCLADNSVEDILQLAQQGNTTAEICVADFYRLGFGVRQDNLAAVSWLRKAADAGNAQAQYRLGDLYNRGELGLRHDNSEALKWFRKSADQGNVYGQLSLGLMFSDDNSTSKNYTEAVKWLQKAADQGHPSAQGVLGLMYADGKGLDKDDIEAYKWMSLGIAHGVGSFQKDLSALAKTMTPQQIAQGNRRVFMNLKLHQLLLFMIVYANRY
jgi:uncharacterized protein